MKKGDASKKDSPNWSVSGSNSCHSTGPGVGREIGEIRGHCHRQFESPGGFNPGTTTPKLAQGDEILIKRSPFDVADAERHDMDRRAQAMAQDMTQATADNYGDYFVWSQA